MKNKNIIIGAGGHAKVIQSELSLTKQTLFLTTDSKQKSTDILLESEQDLKALGTTCSFYFGIGGFDSLSMNTRKNIFENYVKTIKFQNFISLQARTELKNFTGQGSVIMKGSVLQHNVEIGDNVILNTGCVIEHDSLIGSHSHIGPNATLCGNTKIGKTVLIGAGATVIQGLSIGNRSILAAGSVLNKNIPPEELWAGVPARKIKNL